MNDPDLRVCLVSPVPPPYGGIANWTLLIHRLAARAGRPEILQVNSATRWRAVYDTASGKRVVGGALQLVQNYAVFILTLLKRPSVVHLTTSGSLAVIRDLLLCVTCRLFGVPLVYHLRFGRVPTLAQSASLEWRFLARAIRLASAVVVITPDTAALIRERLPSVSVEYIPNPVDRPPAFAPEKASSGRRIALFVGHVLPTKGVRELIQGWSELELDDWELQLVGPVDCHYRHELVETYNPRNLTFVGELPHEDTMRRIASCDLFVLPSYTEGFPNVILEAMALGRPIAASSVGAIGDMLSGGCGFVFPPRDAEAVKAALFTLTKDESRRLSLGERARDKVYREYLGDRVFAHYLNLWQRLAGSVSGRVSDVTQHDRKGKHQLS